MRGILSAIPIGVGLWLLIGSFVWRGSFAIAIAGVTLVAAGLLFATLPRLEGRS